MDYYTTTRGNENTALVVDRLVLKGKGILDLCLEQGKNLCMKGFIDCQVEKGEEYAPVIEQMISYIDGQLDNTQDGDRRRLLLDLHNYADAQLHSVHPAWQSPPGTH